MNTPQGQQRTAEQRWVHWLQCFIRKWSCVYHQFQFHTQIAYKSTYMTHDLCYCYFIIIGTYIRFNHTNSAIHVFGTLAQPFDFRQWLHVCAVKIDTSYFGDLFSTCQQVLGHPCSVIVLHYCIVSRDNLLYWRMYNAECLILNTLRLRQNSCHFADDIFKCILLKENVSVSINISLKNFPESQIKYIPALLQMMAWCWLYDKPLSEPMMVSLQAHICVTRPQWLEQLDPFFSK